METIYADVSVRPMEFKENASAVIERGEDFPVAILDRSKLAAFSCATGRTAPRSPSGRRPTPEILTS